jgi:hypothetical protein
MSSLCPKSGRLGAICPIRGNGAGSYMSCMYVSPIRAHPFALILMGHALGALAVSLTSTTAGGVIGPWWDIGSVSGTHSEL